MSQEKRVVFESTEAATFVTGLSGWVDRHGYFHGNGDRSEGYARYSGCTHRKCNTCEEYTPKGYTVCDDCRKKQRIEQYHAMPKKPYPPTGVMLYSDAWDQYFDDIEYAWDACASQLDEETGCHVAYTLEDMRLVICEPEYAHTIDVYDMYGEYFEDLDIFEHIFPELVAAFETLNRFIENVNDPSLKGGA